MKNNLLTLAFLLICQPTFSQQFNRTAIREDLNIVFSALTEAHPGLYRYNSKKKIVAQFLNFERSIPDSMSVLDFYRALYPMLAKIGDGHTKLHLEGKPDDHYAFFDSGYIPFKLYFHSGKSYLQNSYGHENKIPLGVEIISINGIPMKKILSRLMRFVFSDARISSAKYAELSLHFSGYYAEFIGTSKTYKITYKTAKGNQTSVDLQSLRNSAIPIDISCDRQELSFPNKHVALMKIGVFQDIDNKPTFSDFLKKSFEAIKDRNISSLIIDLRDNEGGMDAMGIELFAYLAKSPFRYYEKFTVASAGNFTFAEYAWFPPEIEYLKKFVLKVGNEYHFTQKEGLDIQKIKENSFSGKVFILQNGRTFSVSSEFCAIAKDNDRAVFIGEESGGALGGNTSGAFAMVRLPNTKLKLDIPLLGYYMYLEKQKQINRGILPDYLITSSIDELLKNKDVVLEKALKLAQERF